MPRKKSGSGPGTLVRKSTSVFLLALAIGVALAVWPTRARALNLCALAALRPKGAFSAYDSLEPIHFRQRVARVSGNPGEFKYHGHLRKMSRAIEGRFPAVQEVQRVLYPMSGTDASAPFQLFPNAELVIALDNHAAVGSYEDAVSIPIEYARTNSSLYRSYREIDESEPLPAILGSLWDGIPGFRLRGVNLFQTPWRALRFTHAEIVFDSGPGTRIRRYVHVQDVFVPELTASESLVVPGVGIGASASGSSQGLDGEPAGKLFRRMRRASQVHLPMVGADFGVFGRGEPGR